MKKCLRCDKEFVPDDINNQATENDTFCSLECEDIWYEI